MSHSHVKGRQKKRKLNKLKIKPFATPPSKKQKTNDNCNSKIKNNTIQLSTKQSITTKDELEPFFDEILNELPNDVEIAMNKLHKEFPKNILNPFPLLLNNDNVIYAIPMILLTQIYSLICDHTYVDKCIDKMKRNNEIRHFQIHINKIKRKKIIKDLNISNIKQNRNELAHKQYYDNGIIDLYCYTNEYKLYITKKKISVTQNIDASKTGLDKYKMYLDKDMSVTNGA
eukprot:94672_1